MAEDIRERGADMPVNGDLGEHSLLTVRIFSEYNGAVPARLHDLSGIAPKKDFSNEIDIGIIANLRVRGMARRAERLCEGNMLLSNNSPGYLNDVSGVSHQFRTIQKGSSLPETSNTAGK